MNKIKLKKKNRWRGKKQNYTKINDALPLHFGGKNKTSRNNHPEITQISSNSITFNFYFKLL